MKPTIISKKAGNWVDRGEPALPTLRRVLAFFFDRHTPDHEPWLDDHANTILGMVDAGSTEVHVAAYLNGILRDGGSDRETLHVRATAIALWHIGKAALVRDFAERVLHGDVPMNAPTPDTFGHWVATRILTPKELKQFESDSAAPSENDED
ncbi:MAG TPA: hypothetical protein VGH98_03735 [Gemmatimonadaceae bacterium]|jgi:hypothetical protein